MAFMLCSCCVLSVLCIQIQLTIVILIGTIVMASVWVNKSKGSLSKFLHCICSFAENLILPLLRSPGVVRS